MDKKSLKNKGIYKSIDIIATVVVVIIFAIFVLLCKQKDADYDFDEGSIYDWSEDWVISSGNEIVQGVSLPVKLDVERDKTVILKKSLPSKIKKYNCLMFESNHQDVLVNVGGILRTSYSDKRTRLFGKSSPESIILVPIYSTDEGADITILINSNTKYSGNMGRIYLGNEKSIVLMLVKKNILWLALFVAIAVMSIVCLACFFVYREGIYEGYAFFYLFAFSFLSLLFIFNGISIRQMFISDIRLHDSLGYIGYMVLGITVLGYNNWIMHSKNYKIFLPCAGLVAINLVVQCALQILDLYDFDEMLLITELIFGFVTVVIIYLAVVDLRKDKIEKKLSQNVLNSFIGTSILFIDSCFAIVGNIIGLKSSVNNAHTVVTAIYIVINVYYLFLTIIREEARRKNAESANVAKSQFLATMSHEIRTPINAVLGMNEMISRESNEPVILDYSANIADAGKSLLSLVNDILDFSKIESGKMDIVCVEYQMKSLLNDLILMLKGRMSYKGLKLILNIDESIPSKYYGDEVRVKQILTNILTNSVKYTPSGSITVSVENKGIVDDEISLYFSVKDTGIGIKKEDIEKLMNSAFIRVDAARNRNIEGTGLGLSITRQLLTLMGSELLVESVYGEGSNFYFVLKQKIVDSSPMGSISVKSEKASKKKTADFTIPEARILAVDDTKTNLLVIKGLLKPYKCQLFTCESGEQCIDLCKNGVYDIIFMDHMMPDMDGIQTLRQLKENELIPMFTKVIALTANAISGAAQLYKESGFDGYVTKPIDVKELDECLKTNIDPKFIIPNDTTDKKDRA